MSDPIDLRVEEYRTLRTELLRNYDAMERNLIACITANGVALAFGLKESEPFVFVIAALVPVYFWIQMNGHRESVAKISSYLSIFHENNASGLGWETRNWEASMLVRRRYRSRHHIRRFLHPYPILLLVTILCFTSVMAERASWFLIFGLAVLVVSVVLLIARAAASLETLRKPWEIAFLQLAAPTSGPVPDQPESQSSPQPVPSAVR